MKEKQEGEAPAGQPRSSPSSTTPADQPANENTGQGPAAVMPRKIIKNGELRIAVKTYQVAFEAIRSLVQATGGYISSSNVSHSLGQVSSARLVLRIPATQFDRVVRRISSLGVIQNEAISSRDITEEYYDLKARLSNARKLETRLLQIMETQTSKVADLLQVERELARVREQVERFEGKLRLFDNLVELSTLEVQLYIQQRYTPSRPPSLGEDASQVLQDSWDSLKSFGRWLLLAAIALLPWALPLAALIWLMVRWWRRRRARRAALRHSPPAT